MVALQIIQTLIQMGAENRALKRSQEKRSCSASTEPDMTDAEELSPARVSGRLRVLATTDLHSHLLGHDYYADRADPAVGLSRVASLIAEERAAAAAQGDACILVDNGDGFQGAPLGDILPGHAHPHPLAVAFSELAYDAVGLGNHDFDIGLDRLAQVLADVPCPVLCANLRAIRPGSACLLTPPRCWSGSWTAARICRRCGSGCCRFCRRRRWSGAGAGCSSSCARPALSKPPPSGPGS